MPDRLMSRPGMSMSSAASTHSDRADFSLRRANAAASLRMDLLSILGKKGGRANRRRLPIAIR